MSFESQSFMREKFQRRIEEVKVPELARWYGEAEPVWTVHGLNGAELARVKAAPQSQRAVYDLAETLAHATGTEVQEALQKLLGIDQESLPEDYVKRLEILTLGSIDPPCDKQLAKRIAAVYPVVFSRLTEKILELSGMGQEPGKSNDSGETPASATP